MQKKFTLFFLLIFCLSPILLDAQVTLTAVDQTVECDGSGFCVPINVTNFDNVSSMQFELQWDTALVDFVGITSSLPASVLSNTNNSGDGYLTFAWAHAVFPPGLTLADGTTIITVCFDPKGGTGTGGLTFADGAGTPILVTMGTSTQLVLGVDLFLNNAVIDVVDTEVPMIACPGDITVNSNTSINGLAPLSFSDNCTIDAISYSLSGATTGSGLNDASGTSFNTGTTTVTYSIADMGGNTSTCSFTVTAETTNTGNLEFIPLVDFDCDNNTITLNLTVRNFTDLGSMQFTTSWDETNLTYVGHVNQMPASATYNTSFVGDGILPLFWIDGTPPFDGLSLPDGATLFTATFNLIGNYSPPTFSFIDLPTLPIEVADNNSMPLDPSEYSFLPEVVTITDSNDPTFGSTCPIDITLPNDAGMCGANVSWTEPTATDNCDLMVDVVGSHSPGVFFPLGNTVVTYTATDDSGNTAECTFTITVQDTENPMILCPSDVTVSAGAASSIAVNGLAPVASDNCSVASITYTQTGATTGSGSNDASGIYLTGTTTVTYSVTDMTGNSNSCSFTVTVITLPPPTISCPADVNTNTEINTCMAVVSGIAPTTMTDPGAISSITYTLSNATTGTGNDDASGTTFNLGTTTVSYTLTDTAGQVVTCDFDVLVTDIQVPSMLCPSVDVFDNQTDSCNVVVNNNIAPVISDNCGIQSLTYILSGAMTGSGMNSASGLTFPVGTTNVTYTALDVNGNTNQCTVSVVVNDNQLPTISCPNDITVFAPGSSTTAVVNGINPIITDNCGINALTYRIGLGGAILTGNASGSTFDLGSSPVTYFVEDSNGNIDSCTFIVTVSPAPMGDLLDCPANVIVPNDANLCQATVNGIAPIILVDPALIQSMEYTFFNINGSISGFNDASGSNFPVGITTVRYIATDINNISDTCQFTVTVNDNMAPVWTNCPDTLYASVNTANCQATVTWNEPTPNDNCQISNITRSHLPGATFDLGTTTVVYTAFDAANNSTNCSFVVVVRDLQAPTISCPTTFTYTNIGNCQAIVDWVVPVAIDNCPNTILTSTHVPGDTFDIGRSTSVIYFAIDAAGLTGQCTFQIMVPDTTAPVISNCLSDTILNTNMGLCSAVYTWNEPVAFDECTLSSFTSSADPGDAFPLGETTVLYTATDAAGNSAVCSFKVTVIDNQPPVLTCPANLQIRVDGTVVSDPSNILLSTSPAIDCDGIKLSFTEPIAVDNCQGTLASVFESGIANGETFPLGTTVQTYISTDANGMADTCSFEIQVLPLAPVMPVIIGGNEACIGSSVQFTVATTPNATYTWTGPNTWTASGPNPSRSELTAADAGVYTVVCTTASGCTSTGSVTLSLLVAPEIGVESNAPICTDGSGNLELNAFLLTGSVPVTSWIWTGPDGFNSMEQTPIIVNADGNNSGIYTVTATGNNGCTTTQTISVSVVELSTPIIDSNCGETVCIGERCALLGTQFSPTPDAYHWEASPAATAGLPADANSNETYIEPTAPGVYVITYWVSSNGCVSEKATLTVTVDGVPKTVSDQSQVNYETTLEGVNVLWNDSISSMDGVTVFLVSGVSNGQLELQNNGVFSYTPDNGFLGDDQFSYQVCNNCDLTLCATGVVTLSVWFNGDDCEVPSVITPNGDGKNDELFINCLFGENFPDNSIDIYNEWGDQVFSAAPYLNDWQGTHNNEPLPDGTYFYVFRTSESADAQKGYVTIFR